MVTVTSEVSAALNTAESDMPGTAPSDQFAVSDQLPSPDACHIRSAADTPQAAAIIPIKKSDRFIRMPFSYARQGRLTHMLNTNTNGLFKYEHTGLNNIVPIKDRRPQVVQPFFHDRLQERLSSAHCSHMNTAKTCFALESARKPRTLNSIICFVCFV